MNAYRAALLYFSNPNVAQATLEEGGLLVVRPDSAGVQVVHAAGNYRTVQPEFLQVPITHWLGRIIAPGFVDMHIHYPQLDVIGSPADGLLQ